MGNWVNAWRCENLEPDAPLSPVERARVKEMEDEICRLWMENEFLNKRPRPSSRGRRSSRALRGDRGGEGQLQGRLDVSAARRAPLVVLCLAHPGRDPTATRGRELAAHVCRVFEASRQTSGCRRVAAALNREGIECSVGLVADLMRELVPRAVQPRAYKRTTVPGQAPVASPDLIARDFTATARSAPRR